MFEHFACEPASVRDLTDRVVLVVEDDYFIAKELCTALSERGAEVVGPAPSVEHGRKLMDRQPLDCAVLDVGVCGEQVFSLASELRARGVPAIFATGHDAGFLPAPFQDSTYLQKPIDLVALIHAVKASMRNLSRQCADASEATLEMCEERHTDGEMPVNARQRVLVAELQHRSRNLLAVVRAIASQTFARRDDDGMLEAFLARLGSLGRVEALLSRGEGERVKLLDVVHAELEPHGKWHRSRIEIHGPDVRLSSHQVQTVALALHELLTNALKYGALQTPTGRLSVTWETWLAGNGRPRLALTWRERGVAMPTGTPIRRGQGRDLIENALRFSLSAETQLVFGTDGVWCRIELPL